jgi:hypothetical protein
MTTPREPEPKQTDLSTQDLPTIPTVQEMRPWKPEKVIRWIQKRDPNFFEEDDLDNFKKQRINGRAFLASDVEFYENGGLPRGVGRALKDFADEVKKGKFTLWT